MNELVATCLFGFITFCRSFFIYPLSQFQIIIEQWPCLQLWSPTAELNIEENVTFWFAWTRTMRSLFLFFFSKPSVNQSGQTMSGPGLQHNTIELRQCPVSRVACSMSFRNCKWDFKQSNCINYLGNLSNCVIFLLCENNLLLLYKFGILCKRVYVQMQI